MTSTQSKEKKEDKKSIEPSMDEILSSIRRIISEDQQKQENLEASSAPGKNLSAELPLKKDKKQIVDVLPKASEEDELIIELVKEEENVKTAPVEQKAPLVSPPSSPLFSAQTEDAALKQFQKLRGSMRFSENSQTLDGLVKEMLHPLLKQWLDEHLSGVVERIVRHEVERIAQENK